MLVHLSKTSPYVCNLNRGPIEQANRMASAPTKKATALLEQKESFPKATRTPLKLLAPDEVPMDTTATATDINASLQPVWYSEQTIVDDYHVQQEDIASIIQQQQQKGKSPMPRTTLTRSTLPPIPSESPSIIEEEELPNQPSLMHKSSTFTIESSINIDSQLNDSEKENLIEENPIIPPSDDSFRALEQLLGLGSATTVRESPKTNHDTLSLTVVTPTDIINATTTSLRMSFAPKNDSDSLPSSQTIPPMPTIESINSTNPPSFLIDNTTMEEEQSSPAAAATTMNQQASFDLTDTDTIKDDTNNDDETNFSFELNDFPNNSKNESMVNVPEPSPPMITVRAPTCADVAYRALIKPRTGSRISQPVKADSPLAKQNKLRSSAPTSRFLRSSCRRISNDSPSQNSINQERPLSNTECFINETDINIVPQTELVEVVSLPEDDESEQEKTTSVTLNLGSPKIIKEINQNASIQSEQSLTPPKPIMPILSREYTYNTPKCRSSERRRSMLNSSRAASIQQPQQQTKINEEEFSSPLIASKSMLGVLLTQPTEAEPSVLQKTLTAPSSVRTSTRKTTNSPSIASKSMLGVLLTQPTEAEPSVLQKTLPVPSPVRTSTRRTTNSPSIASKSMLGVLLTQPTEAEPSVLQKTLTVPSPVRTSTRRTTNSPSIASKSMLGILLTQPTETEPSPVRTSTRKTTNSPSIASKSMLGILLTQPTENQPSVLQKTLTVPSPVRSSVRKSERTSSNPTPRGSINPLHSSTPSSSRHKSLQIVSIGEQEQVSTIVPQQEIIQEVQEAQEIEIIPLNDTEESIQQPSAFHTIETGVQTTPSLDISSRRRLNILEQQQTPIVQMNKSSSIVIVNEQKQITPLQTKVFVNLQRNVRFQLTPATDARLVEKEKFEENLRGLKPDIIINPTPIIPVPKKEIVKPVKSVPLKRLTKPKKKVVASKKKKTAPKQTQPKQQKPIAKKSPQPRKEKPIPPTKDTKKKPEPTKRAQRKRPAPKIAAPTKHKQTAPKVAAPTKHKQPAPKVAASTTRKQPAPKITAPTKQKQPAPEITAPTKRSQRKQPVREVATPIKRSARKRTIPEVTTNPIEPAVKRAKILKSVEVPPQTGSADNKKIISEPIERQTRTRSRSTNNKQTVPEPITKTEPKNITPTIKTSKRRLQSVGKNEGIKKKVEEEKIQPIPVVQNSELSQEERQKIEALTVAALKSRLNTHKTDIPKVAKKADLIALLIKIETNLLKERKQAETTTPTVSTTTMTTRRRKK